MDQQQESHDHSSSSNSGVKTIGNGAANLSLISKRVSSAGALVRQQTTPPISCNMPLVAQVQQQPAPSLSEANLAVLASMEKLRLIDPSVPQQAIKCHLQQQVIDDRIGTETKFAIQDETLNSIPKNYKQPIFNADVVNGSESSKSFNLNDYNELKIRYASMESAYEADRQKTTVLLTKKDAHISRLQERLTSLEHRLDAASQRNPENNNHGLIAERDALLDKVNRLEAAFAAEKLSWETSLSDYQLRLSNAEREFREKEFARKKNAELANNSCSTIDQAQQGSSVPPSTLQCTNCSYFRHELERVEKSVADLVRDKEQLQQEHQRKEAVLSELSAEATELRVQLNAFNEERTNLKRRIRLFEEEHVRKRGGGEKRLVDPAIVVDENLLLRKRLNEAQDYFEAMDIESEQQITSLTNQLEDLHSTLEQKQRDVTLLHNQLKELEHERDAAQAKIKTSENNFSRQQDVIEGLRDELDRLRDKNREIVKDRDDLLLRNAGLSHEAEIVKREAQKQRDEIHAHLADVSRELEQCKTKLREQEAAVNSYDNGAASKLASLNRKLGELENALQDRETTIRIQQQRLSEMKKALQKEWKLALENCPPTITGSMAYGLDFDSSNAFGFPANPYPGSPEERLLLHFQYLKNVILRFVTSSDYEATQLVRAVASLLCLTPEEERLVWDTLKWKMSWVPATKPKLPQTQ